MRPSWEHRVADSRSFNLEGMLDDRKWPVRARCSQFQYAPKQPFGRSRPSFDYLGSLNHDRRRNRDAERFGGFQIHHQLEMGRLGVQDFRSGIRH